MDFLNAHAIFRQQSYLTEAWEEKREVTGKPPGPRQWKGSLTRHDCSPLPELGHTAGNVSLTTGDAFVDQDLNFNPSILCPPGFRLIRCR